MNNEVVNVAGYIPERTPLQYVDAYLASINRDVTEAEKEKLIESSAGSLIINPWELTADRIRELFQKKVKPGRCLCDSIII